MSSIQTFCNDFTYSIVGGFGAGVFASTFGKNFEEAMQVFAVVGSLTTTSVLVGRCAH